MSRVCVSGIPHSLPSNQEYTFVSVLFPAFSPSLSAHLIATVSAGKTPAAGKQGRREGEKNAGEREEVEEIFLIKIPFSRLSLGA